MRGMESKTLRFLGINPLVLRIYKDIIRTELPNIVQGSNAGTRRRL